MFYTANPHADYERHSAELEAASESFEIKEAKAAAMIRMAFEEQLPVPYVGRENKLRYMPFSEAASDLIADDSVWAVMLCALKTSECPKVKAVIEAMSDRHIYKTSSDIAEVL